MRSFIPQTNVIVPVLKGPAQNLYQFTKLRDNYKMQFINAAQASTKIDAQLKGINLKQTLNPPPLKGVFASLVLNELSGKDVMRTPAKETEKFPQSHGRSNSYLARAYQNANSSTQRFAFPSDPTQNPSLSLI